MEKILNLILDKLDAMDQRFDAMDQRFDTIEKRLDTIEKRLDAMDQRFDTIEKRLDAMDRRFDTIEQRLDAMDQRFDTMEQRLTAEQNRQGDLLHQLINTVAATNVKITDTNEKLATLETKVDSLIVEVKDIKNSMATKLDLEYYDQMISEHSRQIYKLKNH